MSDSQDAKFMYEAKVSIIKIVEYGVSLVALVSGKVALPAAGARFDYYFQGALRGPRVSGALTGTDYAHMRADGSTQLHIHAQLETEDGHSIAYFGDGVALPQQGTTELLLREDVSFFTASPTYAWLISCRVWVTARSTQVGAR